jgi:predicted transcriptional regulator
MNARTTLNLTPELAESLAREARRRGVSASALARLAIAGFLANQAAETSTPREIPFAKLGRSGIRDTASRMEELLVDELMIENRTDVVTRG